MDRGAWQATVCGVARVGHDLATECTAAHPVSSQVIPQLKLSSCHLNCESIYKEQGWVF